MAARNSACGHISLHIFNVKVRDTLEFQRNSRIISQQNFKPDQNSLGVLLSLPPSKDFESSTPFCAFVRQHPLMLNQLMVSNVLQIRGLERGNRFLTLPQIRFNVIS